MRYALDILSILTVVPKTQLLLAEPVAVLDEGGSTISTVGELDQPVSPLVHALHYTRSSLGSPIVDTIASKVVSSTESYLMSFSTRPLRKTANKNIRLCPNNQVALTSCSL